MKNLSYWLDISYTPRPPLTGDTSTDVVIIGGGITGISAAYHCAKQGLKTVLIEKNSIASGSAGKNAGMVVEGTEIDFITALPDELSRQAWLETIKAREHTVSLIQKHQIECDLTQPGSLYAARTENEIEAVTSEYQARQAHGIPCQLIESGAQSAYGPFKVLLYNPADNLLHPVKFTRGLARAAEDYGAVIYEQTPAVKVTDQVVVTPAGTITAQNIVVATESENLDVPGEECNIERAHVIVTEPLPDSEIAKIEWPQGGMLWSGGANYTSVRKIDNRLLIVKEEVTEAQLLKLLLEFFPTLQRESISISHQWDCSMLMTKRHRPFITQRRGYYEIFGQGGNGLTNGIMTGKVMAEFFSGTEIPPSYRFNE